MKLLILILIPFLAQAKSKIEDINLHINTIESIDGQDII